MRLKLLLVAILSSSIASQLNFAQSTTAPNTGDTNKVVLGAMPSEAYMPDPLARRTAGEMRKWVENFKPSDATKLNTSGKIVFSWEELTASYPEQARIADDFVERRRIGFVEALTERSEPIPERMAMHHTPDTVTVEGLGSGAYRVVIGSTNGLAHSYLDISKRLSR